MFIWKSVGAMALCVLILGESIEVLHGVVITHFMLLGTYILYRILSKLYAILILGCYGKPKLSCLWVTNPTTSDTCKSKPKCGKYRVFCARYFKIMASYKKSTTFGFVGVFYIQPLTGCFV